MKKFNFPSEIVLPLIINEKNKFIFGILLVISAAFLYLTSNHFHLTDPRYLEMSRVDNLLPFYPSSIWIYLSEYILFIVIFTICSDMQNLNRYFYSFCFVQCASVLIFWIWPTIYPRELFPIPENTDFLTAFVFESLRQTDTAANCCPSLHVSCVFLSVFIFLEEQRGKFIFFLIWGTCIAFSTLTTKQHYAVDIAAGLVMAVLAFCVFRYCFKYSLHIFSPDADNT